MVQAAIPPKPLNPTLNANQFAYTQGNISHEGVNV
jgi:hypothetical protein